MLLANCSSPWGSKISLNRTPVKSNPLADGIAAMSMNAVGANFLWDGVMVDSFHCAHWAKSRWLGFLPRHFMMFDEDAAVAAAGRKRKCGFFSCM
jgi:hypothetical protein